LYTAKEYYDKVVPIKPLTEAEKIKFKTEKNCHICERPFDVLPTMLENKILFTKKAIQFYTHLNDKQSVDKYLKSLNKIEENIKINTKRVADRDHLTGQFR
jgi:translation elongation factor EF-1beta